MSSLAHRLVSRFDKLIALSSLDVPLKFASTRERLPYLCKERFVLVEVSIPLLGMLCPVGWILIDTIQKFRLLIFLFLKIKIKNITVIYYILLSTFCF